MNRAPARTLYAPHHPQAILTYMTDSLPGVTVFGFRLDREALFRSQTIVVSAIAFITTRILAAYQAAIHS